MNVQQVAARNLESLRQNPYPGRGIVIGRTPNARHYVQLYWIMGRSENSRNRVFAHEGDLVRTAPYDASKMTDPSRIIYNCARAFERCHIVSNGDQTDTVFDALRKGETFEEALFTRDPEPDAPNFTPRITGIVNSGDPHHAYKLSVIKAVGNDPGRCVRHFFNYVAAIPGIGHCVHTYAGDGQPLPCFEGEPYMVNLADDIGTVARQYWEMLNSENRVSLMAKFIDAETGATDIRIVNKHA